MDDTKETIKKAIKQKNLLVKLICWILSKFNLSNHKLSVLQVRYNYYMKLKKKYYSKVPSFYQKKEQIEVKATPKIIWFFWYDGIETAPFIVKKCYESILKYRHSDYKVVLITKDNLNSYVTIPDYILTKLNDKKMTLTHFSDILRLCLLVENGGIWMDATVLITGALPDYLSDVDSFVYTNDFRNDDTMNFDSWFIVAHKGNFLLEETLNLLLDYWKENNVLREYFLMHLFFKMVTEKNPDQWENMSKITTVLPHSLQHYMYEKFNQQSWDTLKQLTNIHKLTYKYDSKKVAEDSYLDYLIRGKI